MEIIIFSAMDATNKVQFGPFAKNRVLIQPKCLQLSAFL
jgi:hypothetical protein